MISPKWDLRFLHLAQHIAEWSKDPSTRTGAVIVDTDKRIVSVGFNGFARGVADDERLHDRQAKYVRVVHCTAPEHRTLTRDLRWVPLGSLNVGDELVAFDEHVPANKTARCYKNAVVEHVEFAKEATHRVVLDTGREIIATAEHRWLTTTAYSRTWRWMRTDELRPLPTSNGYPATHITQIVPTFNEASDYESGWLAGLLDGEGTLGKRHTIHVAQRPGVVLDTALSILNKNLRSHSLRWVDNVMRGGLGKQDCMTVHIRGTLPDRIAFLGSIRPKRLLEKINPDQFGRLNRRSKQLTTHAIQQVIPAGVRDIVKITTSTGTLFIEGYPMHNCERNAIIFAQRNLSGCTLYTFPFASCAPCAAMVIQAGITRCVAPETPARLAERWGPDLAAAAGMFGEAGVNLTLIPWSELSWSETA